MRVANIPSKAACPASLLATPHPKMQEVNALAPGFSTAKLQNYLKTSHKNKKNHEKSYKQHQIGELNGRRGMAGTNNHQNQ